MLLVSNALHMSKGVKKHQKYKSVNFCARFPLRWTGDEAYNNSILIGEG